MVDVRFAAHSRLKSDIAPCLKSAKGGSDRGYSITSSAGARSRRRQVQAECFRGLEVDDEFILCRRLHRQVGSLLTLEDAIDIASRAPKLIGKIWPIRD
jgi:hypothetical protein